MSRRKKPSKSTKRPIAEYLDAARKLSKFAPGLKKYARRHKRLSPWEKGAIARKEKLLAYTANLIPVSAKMAKAKPHILFVPDVYKYRRDKEGKLVYNKEGHKILEKKPGKGPQGIRAILGHNFGRIDTAPHINRQTDDVELASNNRKWRLREIPDNAKPFKRRLEDTAKYTFEHLADMARDAFNRPTTTAIYMWTNKGRAGDGFRDFDEFVLWLEKKFEKYEDPEEWMLGLAIRSGE